MNVMMTTIETLQSDYNIVPEQLECEQMSMCIVTSDSWYLSDQGSD